MVSSTVKRQTHVFRFAERVVPRLQRLLLQTRLGGIGKKRVEDGLELTE